MTDLSLVPLEDIMKEIDNRFDSVCVLSMKRITNKNDQIDYHYKDKVGCIGLMTLAIHKMMSDYEEVDPNG